jgi:hypothetical protein
MSFPEATSRSSGSEDPILFGRQAFRGPPVIEPPSNHPDAKSWLTKVLRIEKFTEWQDPATAFALYALPLELRPGTLLPVVRRSTWQYQAARKGDATAIPQVDYFVADSIQAQAIDKAIEAFAGSLADLSPEWETVLPETIEAHPMLARTFYQIVWRARLNTVDLTWSAGRHPVPDARWTASMEVLSSICHERRRTSDWSECYPQSGDSDQL